jgi:hypothetical protein
LWPFIVGLDSGRLGRYRSCEYGYDYFGDTLVRPLRHEPEVNYADGASGVISEPLRRLACRSPLISFSGTALPITYLCDTPLYLRIFIKPYHVIRVTCIVTTYLIYLCPFYLVALITSDFGPLSTMFTPFESLMTLAFKNAIIALLTNEITWNAAFASHVIRISLRPVKAYKPAG